jgi:hypothetical protein
MNPLATMEYRWSRISASYDFGAMYTPLSTYKCSPILLLRGNIQSREPELPGAGTFPEARYFGS